MFFTRTLFHAAPGQAPAIRDLMLTTVRAGDGVIVAQRLFGAVPQLVLLRVFDTLDAYESWRQSWQPDPAVARQFPTLLRAAPSSELWEVPGGPGGGTPARYTVRFTYYPAAGAYPQLRDAIQARVTALQAAGRRSSLWLQVTGGPFAVSTVTGFDRLSEIEQARAANLADPAFQEAARAMAPLLAAPVETPDMFEILTNRP